MSKDISESSKQLRVRIEKFLAHLDLEHVPPGLSEACRYVLSTKGKYVRPLLAYYAALAISPDIELKALDAPASALEVIHTYSLVHDDLPAMDDDDLRRGKPTVHKAYDEATAILLGDGLQALAFTLLAEAPGLTAEQRVAMVHELAQSVGFAGMVGGQYIDIQATAQEMSDFELQQMHSLKTAALIRTSVVIGGIAAKASQPEINVLKQYGNSIGLAFQVVDDILDVEGNAAAVGKTLGKDGKANKPTYVAKLGLDGAREEASRLLSAAVDCLGILGENAAPLENLAQFIVSRDR